MTKTNREKNTAHAARVAARVRPAAANWQFEPLQAVIRQWIETQVANEQT